MQDSGERGGSTGSKSHGSVAFSGGCLIGSRRELCFLIHAVDIYAWVKPFGQILA